MKHFITLSLLIIVAFSCTNTKNSTTKSKSNYWKQLAKEDIPEKFNKFQVFNLNELEFRAALVKNTVSIPNNLGEINFFKVEDSGTMSEELAAKFPNIKSYKGQQTDNSLCDIRIDTKKDKIKIVVFCNEKTYYIDKDKESGLYIVYNKKDAPKGVGSVNEQKHR